MQTFFQSQLDLKLKQQRPSKMSMFVSYSAKQKEDLCTNIDSLNPDQVQKDIEENYCKTVREAIVKALKDAIAKGQDRAEVDVVEGLPDEVSHDELRKYVSLGRIELNVELTRLGMPFSVDHKIGDVRFSFRFFDPKLAFVLWPQGVETINEKEDEIHRVANRVVTPRLSVRKYMFQLHCIGLNAAFKPIKSAIEVAKSNLQHSVEFKMPKWNTSCDIDYHMDEMYKIRALAKVEELYGGACTITVRQPSTKTWLGGSEARDVSVKANDPLLPAAFSDQKQSVMIFLALYRPI
jgi:hypothetical protein